METPELLDLLKRVDTSKVGAMDVFAENLLASLRQEPRSLIELTVSPDEDLAGRARKIVLGLEDTIVSPVADVGMEMDVGGRVWLTGVAVEAEVQLRRALAETLEGMFTDTTLLPQEDSPGASEESAQPRRACDEAYLQLRQLLHITESMDTRLLNRDRFLANPFDERDVELKDFLNSREFTNFMDDSAFEEE